MFKHKLLIFLSLFPALYFTSANATIDRTHVTITNNTNHAVSVSSIVESDDDRFKKGSDWDESTLKLEPYQSKEVLWFTRNIGIRKNHHYNFTLTAVHSDFAKEDIVLKFNETAKPVYGSDVTTELKLANAASQSVLSDRGLFQFPANIWKGNYVVHARKWKPAGNLFDNYHFVINKPETNTFPTPKNSQLSVLTYNTQLMPFYLDGVNDLNQPEKREYLIAKNITKYDVVIMEELFDLDIRINMSIDMMKTYPYFTRVVGHDTTLPFTGGVIIYSKWPIFKEDQIVYAANTGVDSLAAKGAAYAAINKNGKTYHIFGTHAVAGDSDSVVTTRAKELVEFNNFIERMNIPAEEPVIIGGDFNVDEFSHEIQTLITSLHVNLIDNVGYKYSNDALVNLMDKDTDRKRIDYVFYSNSHSRPNIAFNKVFVLRALDDEEKWPKFDLSDHFPVAAYFDFSV